MAEASLMALLEAMLSLAARPALVRRPTINIKAGGYSDDIFLDLTEEQKEEFQCAICYQVLKEVMECTNKHRFCFSCIQVWSTSGEYLNRVRCPVCRCEGHYSRNVDLDNKILMNRVKCMMEGCTWKGLLKYQGKHRHSNYQNSSNSSTQSLPSIKNTTRRPLGTHSRLQGSPSLRSSLNVPSTSDSNNNIVNRTGLLSPDISSSDSEPIAAFTPVPPRSPRPTHIVRRRVPTLPSLINSSSNMPPAVAPASTSVSQSNSSLLSRRRANQIQTTENQARGDNLTTVRDRLVESRNRLEGIMSTFSDETDRHVQEVMTFQDERELNRQNQLSEVQELGRRLGQVAAELRQLLDHRRNLVLTTHDNDSD